MKWVSGIFIGLWCIALSGCVHQAYIIPVPTPAPHPTTVCDTTTVSYTADVQPILSANCYSCHSAAVATSGLDLETFTTLKAYLQYGFRGDGVYGSKLYHCIAHASLAQPMPPTYVLDSCSLAKIARWIHTGAPAN